MTGDTRRYRGDPAAEGAAAARRDDAARKQVQRGLDYWTEIAARRRLTKNERKRVADLQIELGHLEGRAVTEEELREQRDAAIRQAVGDLEMLGVPAEALHGVYEWMSTNVKPAEEGRA